MPAARVRMDRSASKPTAVASRLEVGYSPVPSTPRYVPLDPRNVLPPGNAASVKLTSAPDAKENARRIALRAHQGAIHTRPRLRLPGRAPFTALRATSRAICAST